MKRHLETICFAILLVAIVVAIWMSGRGARGEQKSLEDKYQEAMEQEGAGVR